MFPRPATGRWLSRYVFTAEPERVNAAARPSGVNSAPSGSGPMACRVGSSCQSPAGVSRNRPKRLMSVKYSREPSACSAPRMTGAGPLPPRSTLTRRCEGRSGGAELSTPVMPRWIMRSSSRSPLRSSGSTRNLPRRSTARMTCPVRRSSPRYFGPGSASSSRAPSTGWPASHGASSRLTVSTSGSSGIRDRPFVQGAPDDGAVQAEPFVQIEVAVAGHAATGDELAPERFPHARHRALVHAEERAVTRNVCIDERAQALLAEFPRQFERVHAARLLPAADGHEAVAGIERHYDPLRAEPLEQLPGQFRR